MLYAVHCTYVCVLVICIVTSYVLAWPLYVYLTGPSTVKTKGTNIFGWCPGSAMGVHPEAGHVDPHSVLGMCRLEPNWWVQSGAGECKGSRPCSACSPYNSRAAMQLRSCMQQATHRCIYMHRWQPTGWGVFQIPCREWRGDWVIRLST